MSDKVEQALRLLSGPCPHNRPDSEAPKTKPNCLQCLSETARNVVAREIETKMVCHCPSIEFFDDWCVHKEAAAIARGSK